MTAISYIREELAAGVAYVILPVGLASEISMRALTPYEQGWFDAVKRVWELCEALELKYGDVSPIAELATLLLDMRTPPQDTQ